MNLLDCFRKRMLAKACASYRSTSEFVCWDEARRILIIYDCDESEQNDVMRAAVERMTAEGKRVTECFFVDKKLAATSSVGDRVVIDRKGIDWLGRPSGNAVRQLMEDREFDVIVNLSRSDVMTYVTMAVKAKMKCGRQNADHVLDFQIEGGMEPEHLLAEIVRYLKMIKQ